MTNLTLRGSIHRALGLRLAAVAVVLSIVIAGLVFLAERKRVEGVVVDLTRLHAQRLNQQILPLLDQAGGLTAPALQAELDRYASRSGDPALRDGHFVVARVHDTSGEELGRWSDDTFEQIGAVERTVDEAPISPLAAGEFIVVTVRLAGAQYVGVATPLVDSSGKAAARLTGVFAISPAVVARVRGDLLRTTLYVVAIVLGTAAVLYPIIAGLLGRLARLSVNLLDANLETLQALGSAIAKRDSDTDAHNYRVTIYAVRLAEAFGVPRAQIQSLIKGALLPTRSSRS